MTRRRVLIVAFLTIFFGISLLSAQEEKTQDLEVHLHHVKPEETTKRYHNRTETEYRINQNLYMIKTVPDAGSPYYMVDKFGKGAKDVPWGTGAGQTEAFLREVWHQGIKPKMFGLEYSYDWFDSMPEVTQSARFFDKITQELAK